MTPAMDFETRQAEENVEKKRSRKTSKQPPLPSSSVSLPFLLQTPVIQSSPEPLSLSAYRTLLTTIEDIRADRQRFLLEHSWKPHQACEKLLETKELLDPVLVRAFEQQQQQQQQQKQAAPTFSYREDPKQYAQQQKHMNDEMLDWAMKVVDAQTSHSQSAKLHRRRQYSHSSNIPWHVIEASFLQQEEHKEDCSKKSKKKQAMAIEPSAPVYRRGTIHSAFFAHKDIYVECAACHTFLPSLEGVPVMLGTSTRQEIMVFHPSCLPDILDAPFIPMH